MPLQVVNGAITACTMSLVPSTLVVTPMNRVNCEEGAMPAANILDFIPMVNIQSFGMCMSPANPAVAAATTAALGVLTPMPCIPMVETPWEPGALKTLVGPAPALHMACTNNCMWGGVISITEAGQFTVNVN
jgi:hypothetical protein